MDDVLTGWIRNPRAGRGIHHAADAPDWHFLDYSQLAGDAGRVAGGLAEAGVRQDDVVCVILPNGIDFVTALYGVLAAGGTVCPIAPPGIGQAQAYAARVAAILQQAQPKVVITSAGIAKLAELAGEAMRMAGLSGEPWTFTTDGEELAPRPVAEVALLQFTSGSTGTPRGVRVSARNLGSNIEAILEWIRWRDGDACASWLPLNHDMGLIGCCLLTVGMQGDLWLMRPDQFLRDPVRWVECLGAGKATHTAAPSFGYAYAARKADPSRLDGLDLSGWRTAIVGAEPVDAAALNAFADALAGTGFTRRVFAPAYGLAEATLAVTGVSADAVPVAVLPDWADIRLGGRVPIGQRAELGEVPAPLTPGWLVGCGRPHSRVEVTIVGHYGTPLLEGYLGQIKVRGPSVTHGYHAGRTDGSTRFSDEAVLTGDAGFLHDGELFVIGRMGDSFKVRGRAVFVEDLEAKVAAATGLRRERCVVVAGSIGGPAGVAVFAEATPGEWVRMALDALESELGEDHAVVIVTGSRGLIRRTSSGKPRRRHMWERLQTGRHGGTLVAARRADSVTGWGGTGGEPGR